MTLVVVGGPHGPTWFSILFIIDELEEIRWNYERMCAVGLKYLIHFYAHSILTHFIFFFSLYDNSHNTSRVITRSFHMTMSTKGGNYSRLKIACMRYK